VNDEALTVEEIARLAKLVRERVGTVVVGMNDAVELALASILAGGHVLFEDVPGLGKTLAARSLATAVGLDFRRLQCTPDLLPADITGSFVYSPATSEFIFRKGPLFTGLFLADEINRTSPKTQSALLEAMAEGQVTVEGQSFKLPSPFHVIATSNPIEYEGTYALPEAQLDRFLMQLDVGYPSADDERAMLTLQRDGVTPLGLDDVPQVASSAELSEARRTLNAVTVEPPVAAYVIDLVRRTRELPGVVLGASPRAATHLLVAAQAAAALAGRGFVTPDDVADAASAVLCHRLVLTPDAELERFTPGDAIRIAVGEVAVPR
jgi:MoxR-like ATPase